MGKFIGKASDARGSSLLAPLRFTMTIECSVCAVQPGHSKQVAFNAKLPLPFGATSELEFIVIGTALLLGAIMDEKLRLAANIN